MTAKDTAPATPAHLWEWQPIQALYWCPACRAYAESSDASHLPPAPAPAGETRPWGERLALSESGAVARQVAADSEAQSWRQRAEAAEAEASRLRAERDEARAATGPEARLRAFAERIGTAATLRLRYVAPLVDSASWRAEAWVMSWRRFYGDSGHSDGREVFAATLTEAIAKAEALEAENDHREPEHASRSPGSGGAGGSDHAHDKENEP